MKLAGQSVNTGTFSLNESLLESLASQNATDEDIESLLTELENLRKYPIDLNRCSRQELEKLPFLNDFQISSFLDYRKEKGNLLSIYELQVIHGFSDDVIGMLIPFVFVSEDDIAGVVNLRDIDQLGRHEASLRVQRVLEKSKGYSTYDPASDDTRYPGSPWLLNARYGFSLQKKLKAGFTIEKDPGEELFKGSNHGFDFNSAFVMLNGAGALKSAIVGDYRLAFGQGLTLWSGMAPGKSSMPLGIVKRQDAIKAYSSNDENNFFRGIAASVDLGRFTLTGFLSSKRRDANITDTLASGNICFSSFQESGYHRTSSEIFDEKSVRETLSGANLVYRGNIFKIGATLANYRFDKFMEKGDELKNIHDFSGSGLVNFGVDYSVVLKKVRFFGETAYGNGHMATLNGILLNTGKYASLSLLYRYFDPGFFSMNSSAFSEGSEDCNEEGIYAGIVLNPVANLKISAYADFYRFPWLKHEKSKPAEGNDFMVQADFSPGKTVDMYLRMKYEADPHDFMPDSALIADVEEVERSGFRYHIRYKVSEVLSMQNRFEMTRSEGSNGFLIYHDATCKMNKIPLELDFRLAWFDTDNFDSRIYAYEQDITSGFSFSPLYDAGIRGYVMATVRITPQIKAFVRYATTYYFNKNTIGSSYDTIDGHTRNDIKIRIAVAF
jgi:hypothetical protein